MCVGRMYLRIHTYVCSFVLGLFLHVCICVFLYVRFLDSYVRTEKDASGTASILW